MKALVLTEYKHLEIQDVPEPTCQPNEVLVRIKACGICGSDVDGYDGRTGRRRPPVIMGHEASGIITKIGSEVTGWKIGDRVTFDSTVYCGHCHYCMNGEVNLCTNRRVLGVSCNEYKRNGAFAEYCAIPQHILYRLPENVSFEEAAIVEPLSIAFHAVNLVPHKINASAVVVGAGKIGMLLIQTLRLSGFGNIYAVKRSKKDFDLIKEMGADECFTASEEAVNEILQRTNGNGVDLVFEAAGNEESFLFCTKACKKGGDIVLVGNSSQIVNFPLQSIVTRQIQIHGSCASSGEYGACLDMIARKKVDVNRIIYAVAPLSEGGKWFDRLYNKEEGSSLKVILTP